MFLLLKVLNREELLTWKMIEDLFGFPLANGTLKWNYEKFNEFLNEFEGDNDYYYWTDIKEYLKKLGPRPYYFLIERLVLI